MVRSKNIIAVPPGETIKEQLEDRGLSQKEFAVRMGMSEKHISHLIHGDVQLTPDVAVRLEMVLGVPAKFWNNLEAIYREKIIKAKEENAMDNDIEISKKLPYKEMTKNGWIQATKDSRERVYFLRKFFEVTDLALILDKRINKVACRRLADTEKSEYALIAWAQKAKLDARMVTTKPINLTKLKELIPEIRSMTKMNPSDFCPKLVNALAECGVALIFLQHIGGSFLHGATFYDADKIVVGLTIRGKYADQFWFSLFHELAHILYGHIGKLDGTTEEDESNANQYAANTLIPPETLGQFVSRNDFSRNSIVSFSEFIGIDCGIVVGRLQRDRVIPYTLYNDLKTQYTISAE